MYIQIMGPIYRRTMVKAHLAECRWKTVYGSHQMVGWQNVLNIPNNLFMINHRCVLFSKTSVFYSLKKNSCCAIYISVMREFITIFLIGIGISGALANDNCNPGYYINNGDCEECGPRWYCEGGNTEPQSCPTNYPKSELGATSINECYKDQDCHKPDDEIEQCKLYYNGTIECNTIEEAHLNPRTNTCYANTRNCNVFGALNCASSDQISGTATYLPQGTGGSMSGGHRWDITDCVCNASDFEDTQERLCHGKSSPAIPSEQTVQNVDSIINYNTSTGMYYCTRCILDNGNTKYYANIDYTDGDHCTPDTAQGHVCKCETSNDKGFYRTGTCNSNDNWTSSNNICRRSQCDPGQTTSTILPEGIDNCHYGSETKLCDDGGGCIELENIYQNVSGFNNSSFDILKWKPFQLIHQFYFIQCFFYC